MCIMSLYSFVATRERQSCNATESNKANKTKLHHFIIIFFYFYFTPGDATAQPKKSLLRLTICLCNNCLNPRNKMRKATNPRTLCERERRIYQRLMVLLSTSVAATRTAEEVATCCMHATRIHENNINEQINCQPTVDYDLRQAPFLHFYCLI